MRQWKDKEDTIERQRSNNRTQVFWVTWSFNEWFIHKPEPKVARNIRTNIRFHEKKFFLERVELKTDFLNPI